MEFERVSSLEALPPTELLIVGQGAFAKVPLETSNGQDARSPKVSFLGSEADAKTLALVGASLRTW